MKTFIRVHCDASCDNASKFRFMGLGVAVFVNDAYSQDLSLCEMYGTNGTNNIAEWAGLELGLQHCKKLITIFPDASISVYMDSQLVVRQFNGVYRVKQDHLKGLFHSCRKLYNDVQKYIKRVEWIPREQNKEADELSKQAVIDFIKENYG